MSEPNFDAPSPGPRPPLRRRPPFRSAGGRSWGLRSALIVGALLFASLVGLISWLALQPPAPPDDVEVSIALPPAPPAAPPAEPDEIAPPSPTPQPPQDAALPPATAPAPPAAPMPIPPPPSTAPPQTRVPFPRIDGLAPVPDQGLIERTPEGLLPRIGADGRKPWQVYGRPFDPDDKRPRIALIIGGLGQSSAATEAAMQRLPGAVTLAYTAYARNLEQWVDLSRAAGHEVLLTLPMEPVGYPANDPGPHTLLVSLSEAENRARLTWLMSRFAGYSGVVNLMGSRFTTEAGPLKPVLDELNKRGLLFVDSRSSLTSIAGKMAGEIKLPRAVNNRFIDTKAARPDIDKRLEELEQIARSEGVAVGIGAAYPVTIERVTQWVQQLDAKGIVLAPVSAVVDKQKD